MLSGLCHGSVVAAAPTARGVICRMPSTFSSEWFEEMLRVTAAVTLAHDSNCRIQFDADGTRFGLIVAGGNVTLFAPGDIDGADLELRFSRSDAERVWRRELDGDEAMRAATVVTQLQDGPYTGPPAPADLLGRPEFDALPVVADAALVVAYTFRRGPFGVVHHWFKFDSGRPVDDGFGELDEADVRIEVEYRAIPLVRSGEQAMLDLLAGGTIEGDLGPLAMLGGLLEEPAFRAADLATGRHAFALATLGELWADENWIAALDRLAAEAPSP